MILFVGATGQLGCAITRIIKVRRQTVRNPVRKHFQSVEMVKLGIFHVPETSKTC